MHQKWKVVTFDRTQYSLMFLKSVLFFYRISTRRPMSWDPIILISNNHVLDEGMDRVISYAFRTDTKARLADCTAKGGEISNK
jgi:hypothetical protein